MTVMGKRTVRDGKVVRPRVSAKNAYLDLFGTVGPSDAFETAGERTAHVPTKDRGYFHHVRLTGTEEIGLRANHYQGRTAREDIAGKIESFFAEMHRVGGLTIIDTHREGSSERIDIDIVYAVEPRSPWSGRTQEKMRDVRFDRATMNDQERAASDPFDRFEFELYQRDPRTMVDPESVKGSDDQFAFGGMAAAAEPMIRWMYGDAAARS